jgi:tRNA dimethylallyltransferase
MIIGVFFGATGIGKSEFVIKLAEEYNAEIISADSRQIYKNMPIGTGVVTSQECRNIRHHLVEFLDPNDAYSSGQFVRDVKSIVAKDPTKKFLVVGGTGFYIKSLCLGYPDIPESTLEVKQHVKQKLTQQGLAELHNGLKDFDKVSFERIKPMDTQRVLRAWEVYLSNGKSWSSFNQDVSPPLGSIPLYWLDRPRSALYQRINKRVDRMLQKGWLHEIQTLLDSGYTLDSPALKSLGYREFGKWMLTEGKGSMPDTLINHVKQKTRHFAKRQITFFKNQFKEVTYIDLESLSDEQAIKKVRNLRQK